MLMQLKNLFCKYIKRGRVVILNRNLFISESKAPAGLKIPPLILLLMMLFNQVEKIN